MKASEVIQEIEEKVNCNKNSRYEYEQSWVLNNLFYRGFHWIDTVAGNVRNFNNDVRFRANHIRIGVNHSVAKALSNPPDWDVENEASDSTSMVSAEVAEKYLEYLWRTEGLQSKTMECATGTRIEGTQHYYVYWNPDKGDRLDPKSIFYPNEDGSRMDFDSLYSAFGGDEKKALEFLKGDHIVRNGSIAVDVVDCFDFNVDPAAVDIESARWALVCRLQSKDDVAEKFGVKKDKISSASVSDGFLSSYKQVKMQYVSPNSTQSAGSLDTENLVNLCEYWERPCRDYPKGRFVVFGGDVVFVDDENPFAGMDCELPFVRMRDIVIPGRYYGAAAVEDAIAPQRDYNKARSDMIKERLNNAISKWLVPNGAGLVDGALNRNTDEVVNYNPISLATGQPLRPERIPPGGGSDLHYRSMELSQAEIDAVFGINDVSRGQTPTGVYSGVQLNMYMQEGETRIGSFNNEIYSAISKLGKYILDISSRFISEPRKFTEFMGDNAIGEVVSFMAEDLISKRVEVRVGSMNSRRRAAKQQSLMEALQYFPDAFDSPERKRAVLSALGLAPGMYDPTEVHRKRARCENENMKKGLMVDVEGKAKVYIAPYQDHLIHLYEHYEVMNSLDFDDLPQEVQNFFMEHVMMHEQMRAMVPGLPPSGADQSGSTKQASPNTGEMEAKDTSGQDS